MQEERNASERRVAQLIAQALHEAEQAQREAEQAQREATARSQRAITVVLTARFPTVPLTVGQLLSQVTDVGRIDALLTAIVRAPDEASAVAAIAAAASQSGTSES